MISKGCPYKVEVTGYTLRPVILWADTINQLLLKLIKSQMNNASDYSNLDLFDLIVENEKDIKIFKQNEEIFLEDDQWDRLLSIINQKVINEYLMDKIIELENRMNDMENKL